MDDAVQPAAPPPPVAPAQPAVLSDSDATALFRTLQSGQLQPGDPRAQQAAQLLKRYRDAKTAIGEQPFAPSADQLQKNAQQFEGLYGGLDKVPGLLSPEKRQALESTIDFAPDKNEAIAGAVNMAYVQSQHPEIDPDTLSKNWPAVRAAFASKSLGIDNPDVSDTQLYGAIAKRVQAQKAETAMVQDKIVAGMQQAALSGQADWLAAYGPIASGLEKDAGYIAQNRDRYRQVAQQAFTQMRTQAAPLMPLAKFIVSTIASESGSETYRPAPVNPDEYETKLTPEQEKQFQQWRAANVRPDDTGSDYDFRGAFLAGIKPAPNGHWPDTYKKPNEPTFSNESIYAARRPDLAGRWEGETFIPPNMSREGMGEGFSTLKAQDITHQIKAIPEEQRPLLFALVHHLAEADPNIAAAAGKSTFWQNTRNALMRGLGSVVEGLSDAQNNATIVRGNEWLQKGDAVRVVGNPREGENILDFINRTNSGPQAEMPQWQRPLTRAERAQLANEVQDAKDNQQIDRMLRDTEQGIIDPIKGNAVTKYWYGAAQFAGNLAPVAIPVAGLPLLLTAGVGQSTERYAREGYSPEQAQRLGLFDGAIQGGLMWGMGKLMSGPASQAIEKAIPGLRTLVAGEVPNTLGKLGARAITQAGILNTGAMMQELAHPVVAQVAHNLSTEFPAVDWKKEFEGFGQRRLENFFTMLPLVMLGTGSAIMDPAEGRRYLVTKAVLDQAFTEPIVKQVLQARDFDAQQAIVRDNWFNKSARVSAAAMEDLFSGAQAENQAAGMAGLKTKLLGERRAAARAQRANIMEMAGMDPEGDALMPTVRQNADGSYDVRGPEGTGGDRAISAESALDLVAALREAHGGADGTVSTLPHSVAADLPERSPYALGFAASSPGAEIIGDAWAKLSNARQQLKDWVSRWANNDKLSSSKDAANNGAIIYARQQVSGMLAQLQRDLGTDKLPEQNSKERGAVGRIVEAGMDETALRQHLALLDSADPKQAHLPSVTKLKRDVRYAIDHFDELLPLARRYNATTDAQVAQENANGIATPRHANYVPHLQEVDDPLNLPFERKPSGGNVGTGFKKGRIFDTSIDSVLAGVKPRTLDPFTALENRLSRGQRAINDRLWVEAGRQLIDPASNLPLVTSPETVEVPGPDVLNPTRTKPVTETKNQVVPPKGYELRTFGGQQVAVHRAYASLFDAFMDPSDLAKNPVLGALTKYTQEMKHITLALDIYHLSRMAYYQLGFGENPLKGFKYGGSLLDYSAGDLQAMANAGQLPPAVAGKLLPDIVRRKAQLQTLLDAGLNVGSAAENLHHRWIDNVRGMKELNRFIFNTYTRGGMTWAAILELERQSAANPGMAPEAVARRVALDVNTRFAALGNQSWIKSRTTRGLLNMAFLSPGWNEGLIRSELGAYRQAIEAGSNLARGRLVAGGLLKNIGTLMAGQFVMNQAINYITRGQPTWDNKEEGIGAKISAYIPDPFGHSQGYFLNPFSLPAEITGQIIQGLERTGSYSATAQRMAEGRMFFLGKAADVFLTHKDFTTPILDDKAMAWALTKALVPVVPIPAAPIAAAVKSARAGHIVEDFPGQIGKQILSTGGFKTESVPSNEGRMFGLAATFRHEHGIGHEFGDSEPSDYQPLMLALKGGNDELAAKEMQDLLTKKRPEQMASYFQHLPARNFVTGRDPKTGQRWEDAFEAGLTDEERQTLAAARQDRAELGRKALDLLTKTAKTPEEQQ